MNEEKLLTLLTQADAPLSGEQISRQLGVSRTAIWKYIESLRQQGYEIDSAPRRGYLLSRAPDVLREGEICRQIDGCILGTELICLPTTDSTNTECKRRFMNGSREGLVVISDEQSAGRGRAGHEFISPKSKGLYLTALMQPKIAPMDAVNMTAWVAVAVCDAVEEVCGQRPGIKWTNDIILNGKKLCGILTEMEVEAETGALSYIITGIGVNCNHNETDFPAQLQNIATSLALECGKPIRRADLAAALIRALNRMYRRFPSEGKADYLAAYRRDCVTLGHEVLLVRPGETKKAFAETVDDDFALILRYPDGTRETVDSGEVSVRGLCGYV